MSHEESIFVQALDCEFTHFPDFFDEAYIKRLLEGGVTAINETVAHLTASLQETVKAISQFRKICYDSGALVAATASDIRTAKRERKLAGIVGMQAVPPFISTVDDLGLIGLLFKQGLRICGLTYQRKNFLGDGCGERTNSGLSRLGVGVVEEMNKVGMLLDLSHVGQKSSLEVLDISENPVIFSHSNCRSVCDHVRNLTDEQIKALAEKGGVMCIASWSPLVNVEKPPTIKDFLDHIDYAAKLVGTSHIGIGLDYDEESTPELYRIANKTSEHLFPELFATRWNYTFETFQTKGIDETPLQWKTNIVNGLVDRGYSDQDIDKILGENLIRLFERVWKT